MSTVPKTGPGGPSPPRTRVHTTEFDHEGVVLFVEDVPNPEAYIEIDADYACGLEDYR